MTTQHVPPTSQNQRAIEADRRDFAARLDLPPDRLPGPCEQAARSHDPCVSCATLFLDLRLTDGRLTSGRPAGSTS
jgi:coenzyme F420-reducing hydrogenase alpha subunit